MDVSAGGMTLVQSDDVQPTPDMLSGRLVSNFQESMSVPNLRNKILLLPHLEPLQTVDPQLVRTVYYPEDDWLLVEMDMISFDGSKCNKIGTNYNAYIFNELSSPCDETFETCFNRQLSDVINFDNQRELDGEAPLFKLSRFNMEILNVVKRPGQDQMQT